MFAPWATQGQTTMTLNLYEDETVLCDGVPIYSTQFFNWTKAQTVFPAEDLQEMAGRTITQIKFYTAPVNIPFTINNVSSYIYLTEVTNSSISAFVARSSCTTLYNGGFSFQIVNGVGEVTITLENGYLYNGGNLLIGCENNEAGRSYNSVQAYFYGKNAPGASINGVNYSYTSTYGTVTIDPVQRNFLPRTTFTYTGTPPSCPKPTNLAVNYTVDDATSTATATWSGTASSYNIDVNGTITSNVSSPYTFNVTADVPYSVRVRAACGGDNSRWTAPVRFIPSSHTQIGWGTASDTEKSLPLNNSHNYSLSEQIYTTEELGSTAATFQTIDFYKVGTGACVRNLDIYMVNSPRNSFNSYSSDQMHVRANQADLVYSGLVTFANDAWTSIELNTPFEYDGNHDIAILVDDNTESMAEDVKFLTYISAFPEQTTATPVRSVYHYSNDFNANPDVNYIPDVDRIYYNTRSYYTSRSKNQIRILKGQAPACFKPINITVDMDDEIATTAYLSWDDLNGATTWKVKYATSLESLQNAIEQTVTGDPSFTLENLAPGYTQYYVSVQSVCSPGDPTDPPVTSEWSRPISFYTDLCDEADKCTISCDLYDNGYGWDEAAINIYDDGSDIFLGSWTCDAIGGDDWTDKSGGYPSATDDLRVCPGRPLRFEWQSGNGYDEDLSYVIYDLNNAVLFSGTGDAIDGITSTTDCEESTCDRPTNFSVTSSGDGATVQWNESSDATYNLYLDGYLLEEDVNSPYTLESLGWATTYQVQLEATCSSEPSNWTRSVSFTTDLCSPEDRCTISYELFDDWGDGWTGNAIKVVDVATGMVLDTWTIGSNNSEPGYDEPMKTGDEEDDEYETDEESYARGSFHVCNGREIQFVWMCGSDPGECSYSVYDANGVEIFSGSGVMDASVTYTPNCLYGVIDANGWYAISAYTHDDNQTQNYSLSLGNVEGLIPTTTETDVFYDLFRYDEESATWENQKTANNGTGFTSLEAGRGYIYRRSEGTTLTFNGTPNEGGFTSSYTITKSSACPDANLKGFNLIGNPYQHPIQKGRDFDNQSNLADGFYTLKPDGTWYAHPNDFPINIGEGILVKVKSRVTASTITLTFSDIEAKNSGVEMPLSKGSADKDLQFTVSSGGHTDVAYAILNAQSDDSEGLPKIAHLAAEAPSLSIHQGGTDYAIAHIDGTTQAFPLKFRSIIQGNYTLTVNTESGFDYLHLIDKVANRDIDLLRQPTYTFKHAGSQPSDRFTVKLSPEGESVGDIFAYQNGDRIVVEGTGTLQVYDVLGRHLLTHEINSQFSILNSQFPSTGVYILRLNGKAQKIVIK